MTSTEPPDRRERRERDKERTKSPSTGGGSLNRQSSRNVRMNNIESSVTRLLVATKQLIETLTGWSRRQASETDVSDVYVRLGNEFNIARTCFERAGIEMSDLSDIPSQLRQVLETCLARDASPRVLEIYLPKVREIVINLLQGLKRKQARYRARTHDSTDDPSKVRQRSLEAKDSSSAMKSPVTPDPPPEKRRQSPARRPVGARDESKQLQREASQNSDRSVPPASIPPAEQQRPTNEALQKLQISDALQRRASKRYSAYNFAKLDGFDTENGTRPPIPARRSGSYTPEIARSPPQPQQSDEAQKSLPRRRSPERRPQIDSSLPEEDEYSRPPSITAPDMMAVEPQGRETSPEKIPVFLQLGSAVRKTLVSLTELTLQSLRLLFVEKFQFNPGAETFPDILVTDRETGVRYILEEGVQDITEGTMLTLDVEVDSALKKTFNEGMNSLLKEMSVLQQTISSQQSLLSRLAEQHTSLREDLTSHRHETIRKIEDISLKPSSPTSPKTLQPHLSALKSLKRDLSLLKSEHNSFQAGIDDSLNQLRNLPFSSTVQVITGDDLATQKSDLESKTQALVTVSDDLSDQVDDLRIDITQKRIRPHPRAIAAVRKQESNVQSELNSVEALLKQLKPVWKRKWEDELQQVIDGQEFLRHQETLITDLRKDLADTETVITQIVQAAELFEASAPREWLSGAVGSGGRDAVLGEVKTLQPNSAERLEAIKRAEKQRARELELRRENEFQLELGEIVTESKLKGQGEGALRIEREREEKERRMRRELWEGRNNLRSNSKERDNTRSESKERNKTRSESTERSYTKNGSTESNNHSRSASMERGKSQEKNITRVVSEGNSAFAEQISTDDGVARSQSHSSGLARMKAVSTGSKNRFSGTETRSSLHENNVEEVSRVEYGKQDVG